MNDSRIEESVRMMDEHIEGYVLSSGGAVQDLKYAWADFVRQANINQRHPDDKGRYCEFLHLANECGIKLNRVVLSDCMGTAGFAKKVISQYIRIFVKEGWG